MYSLFLCHHAYDVDDKEPQDIGAGFYCSLLEKRQSHTLLLLQSKAIQVAEAVSGCALSAC